LHNALKLVVKYGYYYTPIITGNIHKYPEKKIINGNVPEMGDREKELLNYLWTDLSCGNIKENVFKPTNSWYLPDKGIRKVLPKEQDQLYTKRCASWHCYFITAFQYVS
jgi:hypothetical protein